MTSIKKKNSENIVWKDSIVEEIHGFRETYAKKYNFDLDAIFQDLKRYEKILKEKPSKRTPTKK